LEIRHEVLPVSPLLHNKTTGEMHNVHDAQVLAGLWAELRRCKDLVAVVMTSDSAEAPAVTQHEIFLGAAYWYMDR
jgi:hypothetical protein